MANRQHWIVQHVADDGTLSVLEAASGRKRQRTVHLPAGYVAEHAHLSYVATSYGVQGATVEGSHTLLTESTSAASVYVGMTRGRNENLLHVVAENHAEARAQFVAAMERDRADHGLNDATERAIEAVRGLVSDGPVKLVNDEVARLVHEAERSERTAVMWEQIAERLDQQRATHRAEDVQSTETIRAVEIRAAKARAEVVAELVPQAVEDGVTYLTANTNESAASDRRVTVGRFGRRKARQEHHAATEHTRTARKRARDAWGSLPLQADALSEWAVTAAERRAEDDPRVLDAARGLAAAQAKHAGLKDRHDRERIALLAQELGADRVRRDPIRVRFIRPEREARDAHSRATEARREAQELGALPPEEAATLIEAKQAAAEQSASERARRLREHLERTSTQPEPRRGGPSLGF